VRTKYPPLTGKCKTCLGCGLLENPFFTGVNECKYAPQPIQEIKQILGIQEKIKL
jgi:hypothetical protein